MRWERERDWGGDQVSPETVIGIHKHSFQSSCPASFKGPTGLHKVLRNKPKVPRCSSQISLSGIEWKSWILMNFLFNWWLVLWLILHCIRLTWGNFSLGTDGGTVKVLCSALYSFTLITSLWLTSVDHRCNPSTISDEAVETVCVWWRLVVWAERYTN